MNAVRSIATIILITQEASISNIYDFNWSSYFHIPAIMLLFIMICNSYLSLRVFLRSFFFIFYYQVGVIIVSLD
jgi:hypothetical protein